MASKYQRLATNLVEELLARNKVQHSSFQLKTGDHDCFATNFVFQGRQYEIEIYSDSMVMLSGNSLYEIYMRDEFGTPEREVEAFLARLARYLEGGPWEGQNETGPVGAAIGNFLSWLRRIVTRRVTRS